MASSGPGGVRRRPVRHRHGDADEDDNGLGLGCDDAPVFGSDRGPRRHLLPRFGDGDAELHRQCQGGSPAAGADIFASLPTPMRPSDMIAPKQELVAADSGDYNDVGHGRHLRRVKRELSPDMGSRSGASETNATQENPCRVETQQEKRARIRSQYEQVESMIYDENSSITELFPMLEESDLLFAIFDTYEVAYEPMPLFQDENFRHATYKRHPLNEIRNNKSKRQNLGKSMRERGLALGCGSECWTCAFTDEHGNTYQGLITMGGRLTAYYAEFENCRGNQKLWNSASRHVPTRRLHARTPPRVLSWLVNYNNDFTDTSATSFVEGFRAVVDAAWPCLALLMLMMLMCLYN